MFSSLPPWEGIHPLLVHFPIALLIVAPVLMLATLVKSHRTQCFSIAALIVMVLGVAGAILAVFSGAAASELVWNNVSPEIRTAIHKHAEMAEWARTIFAILTVIYAALILLPPLMKKELSPRVDLVARIVFLVVWTGCLLILAEAAHRGGELVHVHGIRAMFVRF